MCATGLTTVMPSTVDNSSVEIPVKAESRNIPILLY